MLIPRALTGVDLLGQARTGTGKTASFAIPLLSMCNKGTATQAIVLVPTRELAVQVESEFQRLGQYTPIRTCAVYGGQKIAAQMKHLKHHPEILIGTPGRVIDLLDRRIINFDDIRFVVLDEVDRMLDIGFRDDIRNMLSRIRRPDYSNPEDSAPEAGVQKPAEEEKGHQTIFVSATISPEIEKLSRLYMRNPEKLIAPGADDKPTVEKVEQYYFPVQPWDKYRLLKKLLLHENPELAIVFCRTKRGAEKVARRLHSDGIECREIHGNLAQNKRDSVMKSFRHGKFDVLVATDLASRGIDVADISHIINYDIPEDPEAYVHRVGRTARMGAGGKAFTFVAKDQGDELTKVEGLINMVIPVATLEGWEPSPPPADWTETKPGPVDPANSPPVVSRFERPYNPGGASSAGAASTPGAPSPIALPPRTAGSKIPLNRRHKRRR